MLSSTLAIGRSARQAWRGSAIARAQAQRWVHEMPRLKNEDAFEKTGVAGLYSADGFKTAWTEYQHRLVEEVSMRTQGTDHETKSMFNLMLSTARQHSEAALFNHASAAHNNHFFFSSLVTDGKPTEPSERLLGRIRASFNSFEEFKFHFLTTAESTFGNGYTWLIEAPNKSLLIANTYNAGTPYDYARNQQVDLNGPISPESVERVMEAKRKIEESPKFGLQWPLPLLAVNTWQHAYLPDYGVNGKRAFLDQWFECIDWAVVEERLFVPSQDIPRFQFTK
ncbi:mitochondrial 37S ribosomal protein mS42 [Dipodascopsis tothii]|uniref:mitochondrial 37S ribosomal protein mS42 n=1 Tax=Dipodascopsis tothii TaxID=44089 RepID=UPI0034CD9C4C